MIPVILSGGSGTRLWPVSRAQMPKQFCHLFEDSLQTLTLKRCLNLGNPWIITGSALRTLTDANIKANGFESVKVVYEPVAKNTAPAIALLCHLLKLDNKQNEVVAIFPSDHLIKNQSLFISAVEMAEKLANQNYVVTLGVTPHYPETGYGYIQTTNKVLIDSQKMRGYSVVKFHEKPELAKAKEFLQQGCFSWNAGIFIFKVSNMIHHFQKHVPEIWHLLEQVKPDLSNLSEIYSQVKSISIDYAILEKLSESELACVPVDLGWNDVGSWDAVAELRNTKKDSIEVKAKGNFVFGETEKRYALVGVDDLILIDTADATLVVKKGQSQDVRYVVEKLQAEGSKITKEHVFDERPWGRYEVLRDSAHFKSKVITVNPKSSISYQSHAKREEHWIITKGFGEVVLNESVIPVKAGAHVHIPVGAKHRIRNNSDQVLEFVEVQLGTYFGEDDIVRYQDDYKRI